MHAPPTPPHDLDDLDKSNTLMPSESTTEATALLDHAPVNVVTIVVMRSMSYSYATIMLLSGSSGRPYRKHICRVSMPQQGCVLLKTGCNATVTC